MICFQQSSASLEKLAKIAIIDIKNRKLNPNNCNVYFLSGYVDLSERILDPYYYIEKETPFTAIYRKHEEIVFREDVDTAISRMCNIISQVSETITTFGAKPIFSTIPPASLRVWNNLRLTQNKTKAPLDYQTFDQFYVGTTMKTRLPNILKSTPLVHINHVHGLYPITHVERLTHNR